MNAQQNKRDGADVLIIANHPLALRYLRTVLQDAGFKVITIDETVVSWPNFADHPPVLLIDDCSLSRPVEGYLHCFRARLPEAKVLVVGNKLSTDGLCRLLFLGVQGFVACNDVERALRIAVESLINGHLWIPAEVLERFAQYVSRLSNLKRRSQGVFTGREQLVLGLLERRLCDKEISTALGVKERTVRFHLQNIFDKLGVHDRHHVVEIAQSYRILERAELVAQRSPSNVAAFQSGRAAGSQGGPCATQTESAAGSEDGPCATESETGLRSERMKDPNEHTIPLEDIAVVIASHPQISYTQAVLAGLAAAGGIFVACNEKHMPIAMLLPLESHSTQTERFARQAEMSLPLKKRLWQQIIRAKLRAQARLLEERTGQDWGLAMLASQVRSGDPKNLEARAARIYWKALFSPVAQRSPSNAAAFRQNGIAAGSEDGPCATEGHKREEFRRDFEAEGVNACLNYGYAVVRAIVARALCGAGLHPGMGLHHHNRYNPFCLADDLMEPFRPVVDRVVANLRDARGENVPLDKDSKQTLLEGLLARFTCENESRTLFDWIGRSAASLAAAIEATGEKLDLPSLTPNT